MIDFDNANGLNMDTQELLYIEDRHNRKLFYRFTPASFISNFTPLIVILHDENGIGAEHFEYKMWNVLTPIDSSSTKEKASCWLGEKENFYVKELLQELIQEISEEYDCEDHIYLYGKGKGAYGAILHGILSKANALFAQDPCIILDKEDDEKQVFKESNLNNFLNSKDTFPIFYLANSHKTFNSEENLFINSCKNYEIPCLLDFTPKLQDDSVESIKEVLDMFAKE